MSLLISEHMGFAKNVALQTLRKLKLPIEAEDAVQAGYEGLVVAAHRYDSRPDLDAHFKSYAYWRIRGSVIDESRRMSITHRRGHEAGHRILFLSTDEYGPSHDGSDLDEPKIQLKSINGSETLRMDFDEAMSKLSSRERYVVLARAVGMRGREICEELGVSNMRVSQIAAAATSKMLESMDCETFEEYYASR